MRRRPQFVFPRLLELLESRITPSGAQDITGLTALRADPAFAGIDGALSGQSRNIGVAILDTGMFGNHPDLRGNAVAYYDAVTNTNTSGTVITDPAQMVSSFDPNGHGSHVSGTIGSTNPAIGVATGADLIGVRVLTKTGENPRHDPLLNGLNWVAANQQRFNIRVVNMSLGYGTNVNDASQSVGSFSAVAQAIRRLEGLGVTVVTASGNSYGKFVSLGSSQPGSFSTIAVANTWEDNGVGDSFPNGGGAQGDPFYAIDRNGRGDRLSATSQRSTLPNQVAAPGTTIYSTWNGATGSDGRPKNFDTKSGTSMASPFVAGVVALMQDAAFTASGRYLTPAQTLSVIRDTAVRIVDSATDDNFRQNASTGAKSDLVETGQTFLRINAQRAVAQARTLVGGNTGGGGGGTTVTDPNNKRETAVAVPSLDGNRIFRFTGNIGVDGTSNIGKGDVDLFAVEIKSPGTLAAATVLPTGKTAFDSYLRIFNSAGVQIAFNDDFNNSLYAAVATAVTPGTYYVGVSNANNSAYSAVTGSGTVATGSTGDYLLGIQLTNPDPNGVFTGAVDFPGADFIVSIFDENFRKFDDVPSGVSGKAGYLSTGTIGSDPPAVDDENGARIQTGPGDVDMYRYVVPDNGRAYVRVASVGRLFNPFNAPLGTGTFVPFDTYLRVFNANGQQIASNDDASGVTTTDSELVLTGLTKGQVIYYAVSNYESRAYDASNPANRVGAGTGGYYEIFSTFDNGDLNGTAYNAVALPSIGTPAGGTIGTDFSGPTIGSNGSLDVDFVSVQAPSDGYFRVTAQGNNGFQPAVSIWGFTFDSSKNVTGFSKIASSDNSKSVTVVRVSANTTYYVSVTGQGNSGFNWYDTASGTSGSTGTYSLNTELLPPDAFKGGQDKGVSNGRTPRNLSMGDYVFGDLGSDSTDDGTDYIVDYSDSSGISYAAGDIDTYTFAATTTGKVRFKVAASNILGGGMDPVLRVFDTNGNEIAMNDDVSESSRDAVVEIDVVAGTTYYVGITGFSSDAARYNILSGDGPAALSTAAVGPYTLEISDLSTPIVPPVVPITPPVTPITPPVVPITPPVTPITPPVTPITPPTIPPTVSGNSVTKEFTVGLDNGGGTVQLYNQDRTIRQTLTPFPGFTGGIRTVSADFNGDGVADLVVGTGPGIATRVKILSGVDTNSVLFDFAPFEAAFTGGIFLAAGDINGDGTPDLALSPDEGGGPRVRIFNGRGFGQIVDFFGIQDPAFRGGARVTLGDMDGDGKAEIIVAAGFGGGPRITIWNGAAVNGSGGSPPDSASIANFFAFETALRNGSYVAAGDVNGDGRAEVVFGGGPGGAPRVRIFNGPGLITGGYDNLDNISDRQIANFFAGDVNDRSGVRLAVKNLDNDNRGDLIAGGGPGSGARVTAYSANNFNSPLFTLDVQSGFSGGVYVG
jgi:Subtilase family/FG-GAP-like repeat